MTPFSTSTTNASNTMLGYPSPTIASHQEGNGRTPSYTQRQLNSLHVNTHSPSSPMQPGYQNSNGHPQMQPPVMTPSSSFAAHGHATNQYGVLPSPSVQFGVAASTTLSRQMSEHMMSSPNTHPQSYLQPVAQQLAQFGSPMQHAIPIPFHLNHKYSMSPQQLQQSLFQRNHSEQLLMQQQHTQQHQSKQHALHMMQQRQHSAQPDLATNNHQQHQPIPAATLDQYNQHLFQQFQQQQQQQQQQLPTADIAPPIYSEQPPSAPPRPANDRLVIKLTQNLMGTYNHINERYYNQKRRYQLQQQQQLQLQAQPAEYVQPSQLHQLHQAHSLTASSYDDLNLLAAGHHSHITTTTTTTKTRKTETTETSTYNNGYDDRDYNLLVSRGDVLNSRYIVDSTLGKGSFGKVVRCVDSITQRHIAVKIVKSKSAFYKQAQIEINILNALQDGADEHHIVKVLDKFIHCNHQCIVFEMLHINLYELLKHSKFQGLPLAMIGSMSMQLLDTLHYLQSFEREDKCILHCDLKPENILLRDDHGFDIRGPNSASNLTTNPLQLQSFQSLACNPRISVIDFGSACYAKSKAYSYIQSRFYRAPEVLLGLPYHTGIDMFSLGCIMYELYTGRPLFDGANEEDQIMKQVAVLGIPPESMLKNNQKALKYFARIATSYDLHSTYTTKKPYTPKSLRLCMADKWKDDVQHAAFEDLMLKMLIYDPTKRIRPLQAMHHPFFAMFGVTHHLLSQPSPGAMPNVLMRTRSSSNSHSKSPRISPEVLSTLPMAVPLTTNHYVSGQPHLSPQYTSVGNTGILHSIMQRRISVNSAATATAPTVNSGSNYSLYSTQARRPSNAGSESMRSPPDQSPNNSGSQGGSAGSASNRRKRPYSVNAQAIDGVAINTPPTSNGNGHTNQQLHIAHSLPNTTPHAALLNGSKALTPKVPRTAGAFAFDLPHPSRQQSYSNGNGDTMVESPLITSAASYYHKPQHYFSPKVAMHPAGSSTKYTTSRRNSGASPSNPHLAYLTTSNESSTTSMIQQSPQAIPVVLLDHAYSSFRCTNSNGHSGPTSNELAALPVPRSRAVSHMKLEV